MTIYVNRQAAGLALAKILAKMKLPADSIVYALPRGGVPVAYEIAKKLHLALDLLVVRKIGEPKHVEYAIGAIAANDIIVLNPLVANQPEIQAILTKEKHELLRREQIYRGGRPYPDLRGKTVIMVDDGVATGFTMQAAILAVKALHPQKIILALPISSVDAFKRLEAQVDLVICPHIPSDFYAVGACYKDFPQVSDEEVLQLLSLLNIY